MRILIVAGLALASTLAYSTLALAQRGGNAVSRSASPTGTRDQGRAERTSDFSSKDARKLSPLLDITSEQLLNDYGRDRRTCNVRPTTYVALRLAEKQKELAPEHTTQTVLQNMCANKTRSFAFSLNKSAQDQKAEQKNLLVVEQKLHGK